MQVESRYMGDNYLPQNKLKLREQPSVVFLLFMFLTVCLYTCRDTSIPPCGVTVRRLNPLPPADSVLTFAFTQQ